jgi:hypothetical protein
MAKSKPVQPVKAVVRGTTLTYKGKAHETLAMWFKEQSAFMPFVTNVKVSPKDEQVTFEVGEGLVSQMDGPFVALYFAAIAQNWDKLAVTLTGDQATDWLSIRSACNSQGIDALIVMRGAKKRLSSNSPKYALGRIWDKRLKTAKTIDVLKESGLETDI